VFTCYFQPRVQKLHCRATMATADIERRASIEGVRPSMATEPLWSEFKVVTTVAGSATAIATSSGPRSQICRTTSPIRAAPSGRGARGQAKQQSVSGIDIKLGVIPLLERKAHDDDAANLIDTRLGFHFH